MTRWLQVGLCSQVDGCPQRRKIREWHRVIANTNKKGVPLYLPNVIRISPQCWGKRDNSKQKVKLLHFQKNNNDKISYSHHSEDELVLGNCIPSPQTVADDAHLFYDCIPSSLQWSQLFRNCNIPLTAIARPMCTYLTIALPLIAISA